MTAPTMTRLGELRTRGQEFYEAGDENASMVLHYIEGVNVRMDADGVDTPLHPGFVYRVAPNDGWAVDPVVPRIHHEAAHWAHLVEANGQVATSLPLEDGALFLDRAHAYELRQERDAWAVFQA
jgi:hypothetical protein